MYPFFKSLMDRLVALAVLVVFSPIIFTVAMLLAIANRGTPFFFQQRPGLNGRPFWVVKFKTMNDKGDSFGQLLNDQERLTQIGKFVRKTSLDELPQMMNVLKGDMSIVGPRPLLMEYLKLYTAEQARRHEVKPGITGWAQVNGRNAISWEKKFEFDVWYVDRQSFKLDMKILYKTIIKVLKAEGISGEGSVTMERFKGNTVIN